MTLWALIIISCAYGAEECVTSKTYHPTEAACGRESAATRARLEKEKPAAKVVYFCQEQG